MSICRRPLPSLTPTEVENFERRCAVKECHGAHVRDLPAGGEVEGGEELAVSGQHLQGRVTDTAVGEDELVQVGTPLEQVDQASAENKHECSQS